MAAPAPETYASSPSNAVITGRGVLEQLAEDEAENEPRDSHGTHALVTQLVRMNSRDECATKEFECSLPISPHIEQTHQTPHRIRPPSVDSQFSLKMDPACCLSMRAPQATEKKRVKGEGCDCCDTDGPSAASNQKRKRGDEPGKHLEQLMKELFRAHDLNGDGLLDEAELIKLNQGVAEAHGCSDFESVAEKYSALFREKLDPDGKPVPYEKFRSYLMEVLDEIDQHEVAQEMMVEQFLTEARLARTVVTGDKILTDRPRSGPSDYYNACFRFCTTKEASTEIRT